MYIEEFRETVEGENELSGGADLSCKGDGTILVRCDAKRVLVGAGARALFYPTLIYNVVRNRIQADFRWWDWIDQFVLLGAVPFPSDIHRLKELGVSGVVTLNEPYEALVPSSLYEVKYRQMKPDAAYDYVKSIRLRVCLASLQWKAVVDFYHLKVKGNISSPLNDLVLRCRRWFAAQDLFSFDDGSVVVVSKADLVGYESGKASSSVVRSGIWSDVNFIYQLKIVSRLSCLWVQCQRHQKVSLEKLTDGDAPPLGNVDVDIHVFS